MCFKFSFLRISLNKLSWCLGSLVNPESLTVKSSSAPGRVIPSSAPFMRAIAKISFAIGFLSVILLFQILPSRSFPSISIALIYLPLRLELKNARLVRTWIARNIDGHEFSGGFALNIGNPHIIFFVEDCFGFDLKKIGPIIENYEFFPDRCNVTFAQILDKKNIKVNVWERGAGQTKACGTAACATAVAASVKGLVDKNSNIHFKEGNLQIDCKEEVFMTGPISKVKKIMVDI